MSGRPTDDQLRQAVDALFKKYDTDKSGFLESPEVTILINDAVKNTCPKNKATEHQINQFISAVDTNGDGKIPKSGLFLILKSFIGSK